MRIRVRKWTTALLAATMALSPVAATAAAPAPTPTSASTINPWVALSAMSGSPTAVEELRDHDCHSEEYWRRHAEQRHNRDDRLDDLCGARRGIYWPDTPVLVALGLILAGAVYIAVTADGDGDDRVAISPQ